MALGSARSALKADLIEAALGGAKEEDVFLHYEVQIYVVVLSHNC